MIPGLILLITYISLGAPLGILLITWALISGDIRPLYAAANFVTKTGFSLAGIRVRTTGTELIPKGKACIFMVNHLSNLDPPAFIPRIPGRTSAFLKKSLMKIPILGVGMRLARFIPVDRSGSADGARESVAMAKAVLADGIHITIFVEGTRSRDGKLLPFKKGPFYLAKETGAPCIPVSIQGTENLMKKGSMKVHRGDVKITFHPPLDPADFESREDLLMAVRRAIASGLPESMRGNAMETNG